MNDKQNGGIVISSVSGDLSFQAGGDIVAGNKTTINNIIQRNAKELTTTPYKFLASYDIADRDIFYGRNPIIEELAAQVGRHKVILINGASGSGKSSLVNAGLIPRVADNGYVFAAFREYSDPLAQLQSCFDTAHSPSPPQAPTQAAGGQGSLLQLIRGFGASPIVIFLDQFERFFVRVADDKRRAFVAAFSHCLRYSDAKDLCFILAVRREFFGQLAFEAEQQIPEFISQAYRINLLPLNLAEAREAIVRPLENTGLKIQYDEDFVDNVLLAGLAEQTSGGANIDPPHLQIVCNQLFEAARQRLQTRSSVLINRALYDELGGSQNILNTYLDKVVEDVAQDPERIDVVRSILKTMVDAGSNTRVFVAKAGFDRALPDVNEAEILRFVEKLLDRRVVEERKPTYSLSHEHMVGKVKEWFDPRELERKRAEETLERGMKEWKNSRAVLNRAQAERIRKWLPNPSREERELLQASEKNSLEEERRKASLRMLKRLVMIVALTLSGLAAWQWRVAVAERNAALIGQSRVIASQAEDKIGIGKVSEGIALAISALPGSEEMPNRPYVASAEAALIHGLSSLREKSVYNAGDPIIQVALSPIGRYLLTRSTWGEVQLWDVGLVIHMKVLIKRVTSLHDGAEAAEFIAFDPTGNRIVVTLLDHTARLWNLSTGSEVRLVGHNGPLRHAAFSPDGTLVATASDDHTVGIWMSDSGARIATLEGHEAAVNHVEFDTIGRRLVSSSDDKTARVWSTNGWKLIARCDNGAAVRFARFSADGEILLVISKPDAIVIGERIGKVTIDNAASLRHAASGELKSKLTGHAAYIQDAEFSPDGEHILTASDDGTARVWSSTDGNLVETYSDLPTEAYTATHGMSGGRFIDQGRRFITVGRDAKIRVWTMGDPKATAVMSVDQNAIFGLAASRDRSLFATASGDGTARVWAADTLDDLSIIHAGDSRSSAIQTAVATNAATSGFGLPPSDSTRVLRFRGERAELTQFNAASGIILSGHTAVISRAEFSSDGRYVATICGRVAQPLGFGPRGKDFTARIWDADNGSLIAVLSEHGANVERAKFSPRAGTVVTGSLDGKARVWNLPEGQLERILDGGGGSILDLAFSPNGALLVTSSERGIARIWQLSTGVLIATLSDHHGPIEHVEFSPNGRYVLTASRDGSARIWDAASGVLDKAMRFGDDLNFAAFMAHGTRIVTAMINPGKYVGDGAFGSFLNERTAPRSIVIWDVSSGEKLQELTHEEPIRNLYIFKDGEQIFSQTSDSTLRIWKPFLSTGDTLAVTRDVAPKRAIAPKSDPR